MKDIECPYCGYVFFDEDFAENQPGRYYELECPECEETMKVNYEFFPSFNAKKMRLMGQNLTH